MVAQWSITNLILHFIQVVSTSDTDTYIPYKFPVETGNGTLLFAYAVQLPLLRSPSIRTAHSRTLPVRTVIWQVRMRLTVCILYARPPHRQRCWTFCCAHEVHAFTVLFSVELEAKSRVRSQSRSAIRGGCSLCRSAVCVFVRLLMWRAFVWIKQYDCVYCKMLYVGLAVTSSWCLQ